MIYTTVVLTTENNESKYNKQVLLYRGDKNVEIRFEIKDDRFTVLNSTYAQMIIKRPSATSIFSDISRVENNTFVLVITGEMIDELSEIGEYSYQIRLFDDTQASRATLPPAINGILIEDPLTSEDELNAVGMAEVGRAMVGQESDHEECFDAEGFYNKTIWHTGDIITEGKLNKVEEAIETLTDDIQTLNNNISEVVNETTTEIKEDIAEINAKNYEQDMNIKCLFSHTSYSVDAEFTGNEAKLINSKSGTGYINSIEGNTKVNLCDQKDPIPLTKSYTVETGNHVALEGEYDGKAKPYVYGNTLWIDNDTQELIYEFDSERNLRLQSSFEDGYDEELGKYKVEYKVTGKNKFNPQNYLSLYPNSTNDGGLMLNDSSNDYIGYIKCKPNTLYTISKSSLTFSSTIMFTTHSLPKKGEPIYNRQVYSSHKVEGYLTDNNAEYLGFRFMKLSDTAITFEELLNTIQVEEGTVATPYEPYKEYTKTLYLNSPLLEGDSIEVSGNDIVHVHRYKKVVFDGSEDWVLWRLTDATNLQRYYCTLEERGVYNEKSLFCDQMPYGNSTDHERISIGGALTNEIIVVTKHLTLSRFKNSLQQNPITIVYELKTPTYEVISSNDDLYIDSYVNGHLDFDSAVPIDKVNFREFTIRTKYLNTNTTYIIQFESDNNARLYNCYMAGVGTSVKDITKGINKFTLTTKDNIPYYDCGFTGIGCNISNIVVTEAIDYDFDYFEGLSSAFESEYDEELGKYKVEYKVYKASFGIQDFEFGKGGRLQ